MNQLRFLLPSAASGNPNVSGTMAAVALNDTTTTTTKTDEQDYYYYSGESSSWEEDGNDDDGAYVSSLSVTQDKILALLPILPSLLSAWGSFQIIWMVLSSPKSSAYRRILLGMSCSDFVSSLSLIWQPFLVPANTSQSVWAIGNDVTCNAMGWFVQFAFCSVWYNMMLSVYFLLLVRFNLKDQDFQRKYEPCMHFVCVGFPLVTATTGAIIGLYREMQVGDGCWITRYPEGCFDCTELEEDGVLPDGMVCCISTRFGWSFGGVPTMMSFVIIVTNYLVAYRHVKRTVSSLHDTVMSSRSPTADPYQRRIRAVLNQCCLYVLAFLVCYLPAFALRVMESLTFDPEDEDKLFPMLVIQAVTLPCQGLLNCLVYCRPTYLRARQDFPNESKYWAFRRALHGDRIQPTDEHRESSLFEAPAFSHVVLSPSQARHKPSDLGIGISSHHLHHHHHHHHRETISSLTMGQDTTTTVTKDLSWSHSRRLDPFKREMPPAMPRRHDTEPAAADDDVEKDDEGQQDPENPFPLKGGLLLLRWISKHNNNNPQQQQQQQQQQPGDNCSNFVSSLRGSEYDCVDVVPSLPHRVESQIEGLPPIPPKMKEFISSELDHHQYRHNDTLPVGPERIGSVLEEDNQQQQQQHPPSNSLPVRRSVLPPRGVQRDSYKADASKCIPFEDIGSKKGGGFVLTLKGSSGLQGDSSQFVSSLVGSEFDYIDEAPSQPVRADSQADEGIPTTPIPSEKKFKTNDDDKLPTLAHNKHEKKSSSMDNHPSETSKNAAAASDCIHPVPPPPPPPPGRRNPFKGFLLSITRKNDSHHNDSHFVSSLVGSEFDFIDEAPKSPARVESQGPQPTDNNHAYCSSAAAILTVVDRAPVLPARERSSLEKQQQQQPEDNTTIPLGTKSELSRCPPPPKGSSSPKFSLLDFFHRREKLLPPGDRQMVSSQVESGVEFIDEAPQRPARMESQGDSQPISHRPARIMESQGESRPISQAKSKQSSSPQLKSDDLPIVPTQSPSEEMPNMPRPKRVNAEEILSNSHVPPLETNGLRYSPERKNNPRGSELDCIDTASELPSYVERKARDPTPQQQLNPYTSLELDDRDRSLVAAPARERRYSAETIPTIPRRLDTETDDSVPVEDSSTNGPPCGGSLKGILKGLKNELIPTVGAPSSQA